MRTFVLILAFMSLPTSVLARSKHEYSYPFSRVWNASVRLVRVDLACPITEKDKEDGYFLFDYKHAGQSHSGSVELIRTRVDGVDGVQVVIQVVGMPRFIERMIFTRLTRKLAEDYGQPLQPIKKEERKTFNSEKQVEKRDSKTKSNPQKNRETSSKKGD